MTWGGPENTNVRWKVSLPGVDSTVGMDQNQSSPIVSRGRVFVTMSYWPAKVDSKKFPEHHVACYRTTDGKRLWDVTVPPGPWLLNDLRGGYTAPTPAADGERVYAVFGSSVVAALDFDGKPVWRAEIAPYKFDVALSASPVLFRDTVLLQCDQTDKQSRLLALDKKTGAVVWEDKRPSVGFAHSTPVLAEVGGRSQLLVSASNAIQGLDPTSGKMLWTCAAKGDTVSPVFADGVVYIDSGRGGPGIAVDPTGTGDVTKTHLKWTVQQPSEGLSSPVVSGPYLYRLRSPEVLTCVRMDTGKVAFTERLSRVSTASSPVATPDGHLFLASAGRSYVLAAGPKLDILATNDLDDGGSASPAVADGRIYLKGRKWLFCIGTKE
ncbi:hypothetical protein FRUB_03462 [Fimbriiglobus ruber]|uniref:Pyrrolo-quinoline quinone repeat domain-containing protein n=1 Tax=Fimbriiglobus ruber TaxID=1908690 RepID=A0A225DS32_9BACT|nr:hypothetical protein FRUB_03462 [Fimbriiglobus ruber]